MSTTTNRLKFEQLTIGSYAGMTDKTLVFADAPEVQGDKPKLLDPDQGLVIFFPEGLNYVEATGDQEVGKSSLLALIRELGGEEAPANAVNTTTRNKKVEHKFWGKDGCYYHVVLSKAEVKLYRIDTDEEGKPIMRNGKEVKSEVKQPKAMLKTLLGPVGNSPMELQQMEPEDQINWLRKMSNDQNSKTEEDKIKAERKVLFKSRTAKNNEVKTYKSSLSTNDYYTKQEEWLTYFETSGTEFNNVDHQIHNIQVRYDEYNEKSRHLEDQKTAQENLQKHMATAEKDILDLEEQIKLLQQKIVDKQNFIANGHGQSRELAGEIAKEEAWLKRNAKVKEEYATMGEKQKHATEFKLQQQAFNAMLDFKKKMDEAQQQADELTTQINEKDAQITALVGRFAPKIEQFEVFIPNEDEEQYKHGLYYKGKPLSHLAESALWEMYTLLCKYYDIRIIIVENINALGTGSIEKFNEFLQNGGLIFGSVMKRKQEKLGIIFHFLIQ